MDIEIRHLHLLLMVDAEGSLTKAAARLNLTQSALSHQLRGLEDKLGMPVFRRVGNRMALTEVGGRMLESARTIESELRVVEEDIRRIRLGETGTIRVSTGCYTCYPWLTYCVRQFREERPDVEVLVVSEATRRPVEVLLEGKLNLAITASKPKDTGLLCRPLFRDELVLLTNPDHPLAGRKFIEPKHLVDEHLVLFVVYQSTVMEEFLGPSGVRPHKISQIELPEAILALVEAGMGVTAMARWAAAPQLESGKLCAVPLTRRGLFRQWYATTIDDGRQPGFVEEFIDVLADARHSEHLG